MGFGYIFVWIIAENNAFCGKKWIFPMDIVQ